MLYQAAVILLLPLVAGLVMRQTDARALAWVLQLLPVSFVYRIRGNQEHPLLMCFLALIYATDRSRTQPAWIVLMAVSFCWLALIKGAFAMFALIGGGPVAARRPAAGWGSRIAGMGGPRPLGGAGARDVRALRAALRSHHR